MKLIPFPQNKPGEMSDGAEGSALWGEVLGSHIFTPSQAGGTRRGLGEGTCSYVSWHSYTVHWVDREGRTKGESRESKVRRITSPHARRRTPKPIPGAGWCSKLFPSTAASCQHMLVPKQEMSRGFQEQNVLVELGGQGGCGCQ